MIKKGSPLSRFAALLLLLLAIALLHFATFEPVSNAHRTYDESIATSQLQLARLERHAGNSDQLKTQLAALKRTVQAPKEFLKGKNPALMPAHLLSRVKREIQSNGGTLNSVQVLPTGNEDLFPKIIVKADIRVTPEALKKILYTLESKAPALFIDNVLITGKMVKRTVNRGGNTKEQQSWNELLLDVRFDVFGFVWEDQPS